MRKLAREAVIFMLVGMLIAMVYGFVRVEQNGSDRAKYEAATAVRAVIENPPPPPGFTLINTVKVPLTTGVVLQILDCHQLYPPQPGAARFTVPPGYISAECVHFSDDFQDRVDKYGGHLTEVPLGDANQVAIEKQYWVAYKTAKRDHRIANFSSALVDGVFGFAGGFGLWLMYRLVRFAVQG